MEIIRDASTYEELARAARQKADEADDADLKVRLREQAVRYERKARQLRRMGC